MKAILRLGYTDKLTASIRYYADKRKVVKSLDALNVGVASDKPKDIIESLLVDHHDPTACKAARTFIISAATPPDATPEQLKAIDAALEKAFYDFKGEMGGLPMVGWIHGNTRTRHVHGIMPNSDGRRGLDIGPKQLSRLQDFFGLGPSTPGAVKVAGKRSRFIRWPKTFLSAIWRVIWPM